MNEKIYNSITQRIDEVADDLLSTSHAIHEKPELAFKEFFACETLTNVLEENNIDTRKAVYSLETSFEAILNPSDETVTAAILAEYDALPGIGHACGHNIIATSALGATLGLQAVADQLPGRYALLAPPPKKKEAAKN